MIPQVLFLRVGTSSGTIATGLEEHAEYAKSFIEAVPLIKAACPGVKTSGGISNLSFAFRGNNAVREAMNSAFL